MGALLDAMLRRGLPFLAKYRTPADLSKWKGDLTNPNDAEAVAYSKLLAGDTNGARRALTAVAKVGRSEDAKTRPWMTTIAGRVERVASALDEDVETARSILASWCAESVANLKLPVEEDLGLTLTNQLT